MVIAASEVIGWIITAAIAVFASVTAPVLLVYLTARTRHTEKEEDWRRQDAVAAKVAEVAATAARGDHKLDIIHKLVNSALTAAMEDELRAHEASLDLLREVIALTKASGNRPSRATLASVRRTEAHVIELRANLADRAEREKEIERLEARQKEQR